MKKMLKASSMIPNGIVWVEWVNFVPIKVVHSARQLGSLIKRVRKAYGLTQRALAAASGTGVRFIQDLERGKATCALDKSLIVAAMLGIRLEAKLPQIHPEK